MRILHSVFSWLPPTQAWLGRLIDGMPDTAVLAIARDGQPHTTQDVLALTDLLPPVARAGAAYEHWRGAPWSRRGDRVLGQAYARMLQAAARLLPPADVTHAHFGDQGYRCRLLPTPLVVSFYGYDYGLAQHAWWHAAFGRLFERAELIVAEAPGAARLLAHIGCPPEKIRVHPLGVDLAELPFRPRFPRKPMEVLFVGRFEEKKGLSDALEAVARAGDRFRLSVVGDGPARLDMEALAATYGISVRWRGALPYPELVRELVSADLLIAPSRTASNGDTEGGLPMVVLEALATGLPVLATTHADLPWVVRDGLNGTVVPEGDPVAMAYALRLLADHPERWPIMGAAGRSRVSQDHDAGRQGARLLTLYQEAAALARCSG